MTYADLQNKDLNELQIMLKELQIQLGKLRFQLADKALKDYSKIKKARKGIARILTAINVKKIEKSKQKVE